jgi:outer membrane immunogenic protein
MKKVTVGVTLALAVVTSNAAADGIDRRPPPSIAAPEAYVPPPSWSGFYIGAGVGGAAILHDVSVRDVDFGRTHADIGRENVFGTAIVGWDWQVSPNAVFGVFVDYDFTGNNSSDISAFDGLMRAGVDHNNTWSVGGRFGLLSSPSTLWYVTGGFTQARFDTFVEFEDLGRISRDHTFSGGFVGGGVDTRLGASNWFLRLEYRFSDFSRDRLFQDEFTRVDLDPDVHTVRTTLTYKFASGGYGWAPNGWGGWGR